MNDSQRPKPSTPTFEVPDLDLEPAPRSFGQAAPAAPLAAPKLQRPAPTAAFGTPTLFDEDSVNAGSLSLELDNGSHAAAPAFAGANAFDDSDAFELEPSAQPNLHTDATVTRSIASERGERGHAAQLAWPTGRALDPAQLKIDAVELAILADYGEAPRAVQLTPSYALRVFTRQRELKRQLLPVSVECDRAAAEREATLAEMARAVRPEAERIEQFRRLFAPLVELEQVASQRGQALSSVNAQLNAQSSQVDGDLTQLAKQISEQQQLEQDALRAHDERDAAAKRADAKLKRVHIEIRAVTQVAEQKVGPQGGQVPEPEATQLAQLRQRAEAIKPELSQSHAELDQAKHALGQVRARLDALRQSERLASRKKQALGEHYQKELQLRSQGLSESETAQRAALADLGRALLAAGGAVDVPTPWLERVRAVSERAEKLTIRREMQLRAIDAYDRHRVAQGVRLACSAVGFVVLLIVLKIVL